jgi:hypothetical protein
MDAKKILHEIAENEHEKYHAFKDRLIEYCSNKKNAVVMIFRALKVMQHDLNDCLDGKIEVNVDKEIITKVIRAIKIELYIVRNKMQHLKFLEHEPAKPLKPVGKWTSDKIYLVELIYAIHKSVNHGNVSIQALQECFEYIFDVQLGNIEEQLKEIEARQGNKAQYLERLIHNMNHIHDEYSFGAVHGKLKWTGLIIDFVELFYAAHASGNINKGKVSLKKMFAVVCEVFDVDVKDFYQRFSAIKIRVKGDRTKFLDELKQVLVEKLEKADNKPSKK